MISHSDHTLPNVKYFMARINKQEKNIQTNSAIWGEKTMAFKDNGSIKPFEQKVWLSSPTMHGDEAKYMMEAYDTNWMSTVGKNINEIEAQIADLIGVKYAVAMSCGTAALHLATKLAGERLYGQAKPNEGTLFSRKIFASDTTFDASINPIAYEDGDAVFIDTEPDTWNMDPVALEKAFELYPDTKLVVLAHLYGTPGKMEEIKSICDAHGALIVEDAAESLGARYKLNGKWVETGSLGDFNAISFNGNNVLEILRKAGICNKVTEFAA